MPWEVRKDDRCPSDKPWAVIKTSDNTKVACHATKELAEKQRRLLYSEEPPSISQAPMDIVDLGREFVSHKSFSAKDREKLAAKGQAMPGGGFPIRNSQDLKNAIQAIGRASNYDAAKAHIIKRAKALGLTELLPDDWKEAKQMDKVENFLEHFGVKGMRWGVRRAEARAARADKTWQKNIYSVRGAVAVHNAGADRFNAGIGLINNRHPKADISQPDLPATKRYMKDVNAFSGRCLTEAVKDVHGTSPSGKLRAEMDLSNPEQPHVRVKPTEVEHVDNSALPEFDFELNVTSSGLIRSMRKIRVEEALAQSFDVNKFIQHHGIKGMRWGVRRSRSQLSRAAQSRGKSVKEMSDDELRNLVNRLNMEQQYNRLTSGGKNKSLAAAGAAFVGSIALNVARTQIQNAATKQVSQTLSRRASKKVALKGLKKLG